MVARTKSSPISVNTMPSASIAVLREAALSSARPEPARKITPAAPARRRRGSLEGEHPGTPGAHVAALGAVAAAAAVADANVALAARAHAPDQLVAAAVQPVGAADAGRLDAAPRRFEGAVFAEIVVGVELVAQFAHAQLDHDGAVEEAEHLDVVGDHVLRVEEVEQRRHYRPAVVGGRDP